MHERTSARRFAAVEAASEKRPEPDQPPIEISVSSPGCAAASSLIAPKFPPGPAGFEPMSAPGSASAQRSWRSMAPNA